MIATFSVLGIASVVLVVMQGVRTQEDQVKAQKREEKLQQTLDDTRIDSAKSISFLSGRLDAMASLMANPPANKDLKRVAEAILQAANTGRAQATDSQLKEAAIDLARRLREFQDRLNGESERLMVQQVNLRASTPEERQQQFAALSQQMVNQTNRQQVDIPLTQLAPTGCGCGLALVIPA
jgi:hypothetical protein